MYIDWFCDKCTLQFDKKYVFDLHLSLVHGVEMKVKSEPQDYDEKSQTPAKNCSGDEVAPSIKCDICDLFFKTKSKLKGHIESVHEGKKPFKCNLCDSCFSKNGDLNRHTATVHGGKNLSSVTFVIVAFQEKET